MKYWKEFAVGSALCLSCARIHSVAPKSTPKIEISAESWRPCAPNGKDWNDYQQLFVTLRKAVIEGHDLSSNWATIRTRLGANACFGFAEVSEGLANDWKQFVLFWKEGGGEWLEQALELNASHWYVFPPGRQKSDEGDLSPFEEGVSDPDVAMWRENAVSYLEVALQSTSRAYLLAGGMPGTVSDCDVFAANKPAAEQFRDWRECVGGLRRQKIVFRGATPRKPSSGVLVACESGGVPDPVVLPRCGFGLTLIMDVAAGRISVLTLHEGKGADIAAMDGAAAKTAAQELAWWVLVGDKVGKVDISIGVPIPEGIEVVIPRSSPTLKATQLPAPLDLPRIEYLLFGTTPREITGKNVWTGEQNHSPWERYFSSKIHSIARAVVQTVGWRPATPLEDESARQLCMCVGMKDRKCRHGSFAVEPFVEEGELDPAIRL